jgi:putative peptide zinc metalloprotease protein
VTLLSWSSIALVTATLIGVKILHEFGHALTARRFGCRVPTMGVAFMVFWPVLYTDTTDAWRLSSKAQRLAISGAGVTVELIIAAYATLAWTFLPQGALQSAAFLVATTTWVLSLLVNLNPFMRFDGYFLLSDLLEVENLQERSFALAKWRLREALFGFGEPPPEKWPRGKRRVLILYAYLTWLYRAALYLGLALLIYHFVFKLAGLILLCLELGWLLGLPILREARQCYMRRGSMSLNRQILTTSGVVVAAGVVLATPWATQVSVPALLRPISHSVVYAPAAARVAKISLKLGDAVEIGRNLVILRSGDLENLIALSRTQVAVLERRRAFESFDVARRQFRLVVESQLRAAREQLAGLIDKQQYLHISAPIAGRIVEVTDDLRAGNWVARGETMLIIADTRQVMIEAYISEYEFKRVKAGAAVKFEAENLDVAPIAGVVVSVDPVAATTIKSAYFASKYGGGVPVHEASSGEFVPQIAHYRVQISVTAPAVTQSQILRGEAVIEAQKISLLTRAWTAILAVFIRESGF